MDGLRYQERQHLWTQRRLPCGTTGNRWNNYFCHCYGAEQYCGSRWRRRCYSNYNGFLLLQHKARNRHFKFLYLYNNICALLYELQRASSRERQRRSYRLRSSLYHDANYIGRSLDWSYHPCRLPLGRHSDNIDTHAGFSHLVKCP